MNIKTNFVRDWQEFMISKMAANGLEFSSEMSNDLIIIRYFTYLRKKGGNPQPRRVHYSNNFFCPSNLIIGLEQLVGVLEKGEDFSPYLSKKVDNISVTDGMFNEWGVLHLHLGDRPDAQDPRFIARTGPLLFLYLTEEDAYFINVYQHGDWTVKSILQTVLDNWPELIEPFIIKEKIALRYQFTERQHAELRAAGITMMLDLKDVDGNSVVLIPPGQGMTVSQDALQDVRAYTKEIRKIQILERLVNDDPDFFINAFEGNVPDTLQLKLIFEDEKCIIIEESTGVQFDIL